MSIAARIDAEYTPLCYTHIKDDLEILIEIGNDEHRIIYLSMGDKHLGFVTENDSELLGVFDRLKVPARMMKVSPSATFSGSSPKAITFNELSAEIGVADLICMIVLNEAGVKKEIPHVSVQRVLDKVPSLTKGPWTYRTPEIK